MMIKSTSLDLGSSMLKGVVVRENGDLVKAKLPNFIATDVDNTLITDKCRVIELEDRKVILGVGDPNNNVLKHHRKNLMEQALVMIAELYPHDYEIKTELKIGIPATHYYNDSYVEDLKSKFKTKEWIEYRVGQTKKRVYITDVKVCIEGYSAFFGIRHLLNNQQNVLMIDVGGGTTDIVHFEYNYDTEDYDFVAMHTIETGVIDLTEMIANNINKQLGSNLKASRLDSLLRNNVKFYEFNGENHEIEEYMGTIEQTVERMLTEIKNKFDVLGNFTVVGVGGGYQTFNVIANKDIKADIEIDKELSFYANVIGFAMQ